MFERLLPLGGACRGLGVHPNMFRKWGRRGRIRCVRTVGGWRRIPRSGVERLMGVVKPDASRKAVIYAGFSSHGQKQKGDLDRRKQTLLDYAGSRGFEVVAVLEGVGSGLNEDKGSLNRLFEMVVKISLKFGGGALRFEKSWV